MHADPPGCKCGFMSVERMKILLRLDGRDDNEEMITQRQQIMPDIKFTCDGMITKWIIGAAFTIGSLYPELQVWRNIGNDVYEKINGTSIAIPVENSNHIYEYDDFPPIPFQAGDILGVFVPQTSSSRLVLSSELIERPINYYLTTDDTDSESPYDIIDLQNTQALMSEGYQPAVSVEIGKQTRHNHFIFNFIYSILIVVRSQTMSPSTPMVSMTFFMCACDETL